MKQEIRFLITQNCNYNCYFCHHEGIYEKKETQITVENLVFLYQLVNKEFKINTMTISGGEPLICKNIIEIVKSLKEVGCSTTIVTNGSFLLQNLEIGKYISKLNVSIHSLNEKEYREIVGNAGDIKNVINGLKKVRDLYPNLEININYAITKINGLKEELEDLINFARQYNLNIKLIELFPKNKENVEAFKKAIDIIQKNGYKKEKDDARKEFYTDEKNYIYLTKCLCSKALETGNSSKYCNENNDLFIAQDGTIKICRMRNKEINILKAIKEKNSLELKKKIKEALESLGKDCFYQKGRKNGE